MFVIVGLALVFVALIGGFIMAGGTPLSLIVIPEYVIIVG